MDPMSESAMARPTREKKSRKIFDPADHDQPARKRSKLHSSGSPPPPSLSSSVQNGGGDDAESEATAADTSMSPPVLTADGGGGSGDAKSKSYVGGDVCNQCMEAKNKLGRKEPLVSCRDCSLKVHPSCLEYSEELSRKILSASFWQCVFCKTCSICDEANPQEDEHMLFCDSCDLGYHMNCHFPPVLDKPTGKWICYRCKDEALAAGTTRRSVTGVDRKNGRTAFGFGVGKSKKEANGLDSQTTRFLPLLPAQLHPHTGLLPPNWEEYPHDPTIPDVSNWEPIQIMNYFMKQGFQTEHAAVFLNEEIDGSSLLLLHRQDVVGNLGLKLGPALKVFSQVKKLQTRRNFPSHPFQPTA